MNRREEAFRRMLGREPTANERIEIAMLREVAQLGDDDPFWGVAAFLYARTNSDTENRERLKLTQESLETFGRMLKDAIHFLSHPTARAGHEGSAAALSSTVAATVVAALADQTPRSSIRTWFGEHLNVALGATCALIASQLIGVGAGYWAGQVATRRLEAARRVTRAADARTITAWARTPDGRRVFAWARLNAPGLKYLLSCRYPGWTRTRADGYTVCYPNGSGHGFYLPGR
ncbi:MAG: hypothetical protein ACYCRH_03355 [Acidiferrobacteraceae bacterium]